MMESTAAKVPSMAPKTQPRSISYNPLTNVFAALGLRMRGILVLRTGIRMAVAVATVYALLLNGLLSAAAPFVPSPSADAVICLHDGGGTDQPAGPSSAHDESCCVAMCGMGIAAVPPSEYSRVSLARASTLSTIQGPLAPVDPSPRTNAQASPRGPPSLV